MIAEIKYSIGVFKVNLRTVDVAQLVEGLPSVCKALGYIPSTT